MRARLGGIAALLAVVAIGVIAASALAADQTSGTGKSHLGYTVGYNAQSDLSGSFEYQPEVNGTTLNIHCGGPGQDDYNSYRLTTTANGLYPKTIFNATKCFDDNGVQYFVHVEAIDRGEGANAPQDGLCITVKLYPGRDNPRLVHDCGTIQDGNVQILFHADTGLVSTDLLATTPA
jgi:hypothetical protein